MSEIIEVKYDILERKDLDGVEHTELNAASNARKQAYAPYSNFLVGSTIRTNDGGLHAGWNFETATYDGLHAEVNALGRIPSISRDSGLQRIMVVGGPADIEHDEPVTVCGSCRQKLLEILRPEDDPIVIMAGTRGKILRMKLKDMLPHAFYPACVVKK